MTKANIKRIETYIVDVPIKRPHQFSTEKVFSKSFLLVEIELENGLVGIGEGTTPGIWWNGESVETIQVVIERYFRALLIGQDATKIEKLLQMMDRYVRANTFAKATIEMALYDVVGKIHNAPVHQLLGGSYQDTISVRWALAVGDVNEDVLEGKEKYANKEYLKFKIKAGKISPEQDAIRTLNIAEGLKGHSTTGVDPNGSWDRLTTIRYMDEFFRAGVDFLEQPLHPLDFAGLAKLSDMKKVPIMVDESLATIQDAQRIVQEKAADIFSLKIHKSGGMRNSIKIAAIAEAAGISCFGGTSLESSIGTAACLHAYGSIRNLDYGSELFGPQWLADDLVKEPILFTDGNAHVPQKAGLGIELDLEKVKKYLRKNEAEN